MKKILISILIIGVVAAIAVGGTVAYFTATSNDVTAAVTTAKVSLSASDANGGTAIFNITNAIPGNSWTNNVYCTNTGGGALWVTPTWAPTASSAAIDHDMTFVINTVGGYTGTYAGTNGTEYLVPAGGQLVFNVTLTFVETNLNQDSLQGQWVTYAGQFKGQTTP